MGITQKNDNLLRTSIAHWAMLVLLFLPAIAIAAADPPSSSGVLDDTLNLFANHASKWVSAIRDAATFLFWTLGTISLVFTYGFLLMRKADVQEFFAETLRFMLFFGFFLWLLQNGPEFAHSIIDSMTNLAAKASATKAATPSGIIDAALKIWSGIWTFDYGPFVWLAAVIIGGICAVIMTVVGVNLFLLYAATYVVLYAGFFVLGFGGSRWTSDIAITYYKTVLGMGLKLMTMILIIGICANILDTYYANITDWSDFRQMFVYLVFCVAFYKIAHAVPDIVAGMVSGGAAGVGSTSGSAMTSAMTSAVASLAGAAAGLAGAAAAIKAAVGGKGGDSKGGGAGNTVAEAFAKAGASGGGESEESTPNVEQPPPPAASGGGESGGGGDSSSGGSDASSGGGGGDASSSGGDSSSDSSSDSSGDSSGDSSSQSASSSAGSGGGDASSGGDSPNTDVGGQSDSGGDKSASSNSGDGKKGNRVLQALSKIDSGINKAATTAAAVGGTVAAAGSAVTSKAGEVASKAGKAIADPVKKAASATAKAMPTTTAALGATARAGGRVARSAGDLAKGAGQVAAARFQDRVDQSVGGQIAAQIKAARGEGNGNVISNSDLAAEVQDFVDRKPSSSK